MAPTLVGTHRDVTCADCGFCFPSDAAITPTSGRPSLCPNCDDQSVELSSIPVADGDRLLVHKSAFALRPPRRWEMATFRSPTHAAQLSIKRIVGLPGEKVRIRDGDVYVNGQIARKTLAEQLAMAILVHDATCQSRELLPRWRGEGAATSWTAHAGKFTIPQRTDERQGTADAPDWLTYHHAYRAPPHSKGTVERAVDDRYAYNQDLSLRNLYPIRDLLLTCRMRTQGTSGLLLRATDGQTEFLVRVDGGWRDVELFENGIPVARRGVNLAANRAHSVALSLVDRRFGLAIDGREILARPIENNPVGEPSPRPLAIGSQGLGVEVTNLRVWRDVYYVPPPGAVVTADIDEPFQLAEDEYFVLGDNSPLSEDSRHLKTGPAVLANLLVGKPFLMHYPNRVVELWGRRFQVPAITRIRYIP